MYLDKHTYKRSIQSGYNSGLQYRELQLANCLAMPTEKHAITRERKLFSEIRQLKTFGVHQRPDR